MLFDDYVTPQMYGAIGDGWYDDQLAIQTAINTGNPVYVPWTPGGYKISCRLSLPSGTVLKFSSKPTEIKPTSSGDWIAEIKGSDVLIENLRCTASPNGFGILLRTDLTSLQRINIHNTFLAGTKNFLYDLPGSGKIVNLRVKDATIFPTDTGITLQNSYAYQYMERVSIVYTGRTGINVPGIVMTNNAGAFWDKCDVTNGDVTASNGGNHGWLFNNCQANWFTDCMADMVGGGGFYLQNNNDFFYFNKCISSMVGTHGFSINNSGHVTMNACNVGGRSGMSYAPTMPGIYGYNSPGFIIDDACRVYSTTGLPVSLTSCVGARNNALV